tara:strand:- start:713 stop:889 length:177 start_codon:yes stop_codon:yes gene_type:complete
MSRRNRYRDPNRKSNQMQFITVPKEQLHKARADRYKKTFKETNNVFLSMVKSLEINTE